jgi:hypothetical protein
MKKKAYTKEMYGLPTKIHMANRPNILYHIQAIRNKNSNSGYSNHILSMGHAYWSVTDTMKIMKIEKKGKHLNTLEKYHTYKGSRNRLQMNDAYIHVYNLIFEMPKKKKKNRACARTHKHTQYIYIKDRLNPAH